MIRNDQELAATRERIRHFQQQVEKLRQVEANPQNYRLSAGSFLTEIDRMNSDCPGLQGGGTCPVMR
jgi:hypothetical protein